MRLSPAWLLLLMAGLPGCYVTHHRGDLEDGLEAGPVAPLTARLEIVSGEATIHRAAPGRLYDLSLEYCRTHFAPRVAKEPAGPGARLLVGLRRRRRGGATAPPGDENNVMDVALAADRPLDLSLDLGAGRHVAELGGLALTRLAVTSGIGTARLLFEEPLAGDLGAVTVAGGTGHLAVGRLGNASPASFVLSAGDGDFEIDLRGAWRRDLAIELDVSLGDVTFLVPRSLGVEVGAGTGGMPELIVPEFTRDEQGTCRSPGFQEARHHVTIRVGPGLGRLEARWVDEG